ncbi:MAG TPA: 50S ribosomal protein L17 [Bacteroidales bacterium]|nr:50S ribosomal protein L17 [Bacteroidales bacterium]HPM88235.1 50S ribosomal protein L17 [Bacteroidales bacterium]HQM67746.1 50S ribosomal protein L17 [Bacteroidales bacterium]
MRHSRTINHLGRTSSHRKAMLSNMAASLILHKRITTTTAKAKALRTYVEPLITKAKEDSTHSRRVAFGYLKDKSAVSELFREVSPKVGDRPGGYTRILKTGNRIGDNAEMCLLELVDFNEAMLSHAETGKAKTTRRRRSSKKGEATAAEKTTEAKAENPVKEVKAQSEEKPVEPLKNEDETPAAEEPEEGK